MSSKIWFFFGMLLVVVGLNGSAATDPDLVLLWDPSPDESVTGYILHYGTSSGHYVIHRDVGFQTSYAVAGLGKGATYYFVATAYTAEKVESDPSNEVAFTVPSGQVRNFFPSIVLEAEDFTVAANDSITNTVVISDRETPTADLVLTATLSPAGVNSGAQVEILDHMGRNRRIRVTAGSSPLDSNGIFDVTVKVLDGAIQPREAVFQVTVLPDSPPLIRDSEIGTLIDIPIAAPIFPTASSSSSIQRVLSLVNSSVTNVLSPFDIAVSGPLANRVLNLTPRPGALGGTIVSVEPIRERIPDLNSFLLMVVPRPDVILFESFDHYLDGSLSTETGGGVWLNYSDNPGGIKTHSRALRLDAGKPDEGVKCPLLGRGSLSATDLLPFYCRMRLTLTDLPSPGDESGCAAIGSFLGKGARGLIRGRIFASPDANRPGAYRLGISSVANFPSAFSRKSLAPHVTYTVVTCYDPTTGVARLWIDPISEMDSDAQAPDALPGAVDFYSFQQTASGASAQIDDLVVATSFTGALLTPLMPALKVALVNGSLEISWPQKDSAGYTLYQNNHLPMSEWWPVTEPPTVQDDRIVVTIVPANQNMFFQLQKDRGNN